MRNRNSERAGSVLFSMFLVVMWHIGGGRCRIDAFDVTSAERIIELVRPFGFVNGSLELNLIIQVNSEQLIFNIFNSFINN